MSNPRDARIVQRPATEVMYVSAEGGVAGGPAAFSRLEAAIGSMRGRRFFGVMEPGGAYHACVRRKAGDDPDALELDSRVIPGGSYARTVITDWPERLSEIGPAFDAMAQVYRVDPARPSLEFYRSERELQLLLPVLE